MNWRVVLHFQTNRNSPKNAQIGGTIPASQTISVASGVSALSYTASASGESLAQRTSNLWHDSGQPYCGKRMPRETITVASLASRIVLRCMEFSSSFRWIEPKSTYFLPLCCSLALLAGAEDDYLSLGRVNHVDQSLRVNIQ